jgi:hypothetical protein
MRVKISELAMCGISPQASNKDAGKDAQVSHTLPNSGNDSVQTQKNVSLGLRVRNYFYGFAVSRAPQVFKVP